MVYLFIVLLLVVGSMKNASVSCKQCLNTPTISLYLPLSPATWMAELCGDTDAYVLGCAVTSGYRIWVEIALLLNLSNCRSSLAKTVKLA